MRTLLVLAVVGASLWHWRSKLPIPGISASFASQEWQEVSSRDFESKVLKASVPVLVYFDAAEDCRGADNVIFKLQGKRKGKLIIAHVAMATSPELAGAHGIGDDVIFALFKGGQELRRIDAPTLIGQTTARKDGVFTDENFLLELENFIGPL